MPTIIDQARKIWDLLYQSPAQQPIQAPIHHDHTDIGQAMPTTFQPDGNYFQVRINEMYLTYDRQWFSIYDPMVFVVTEFIYNKQEQAVPVVVGPQIMEKFGKKMPNGMIFSDTRVAGIHPYRGGRLTLSVVLCNVQRQNYARDLLQLIEKAGSVLDFSTALSSYVKIGSVVLDGVEALFGSGNTNTIMGLRKEFDPDAGDAVQPSYFVLIDKAVPGFDERKLWVQENKLFYGDSLANAHAFRDANYVLYSITAVPARSDVTTLDFYPLYERAKQEAMSLDEDSWKRTKADLLALYQTLVLSSDLTPKQADELCTKYVAEIQRLHENALQMGTLETKGIEEFSEVESKLRQAVKILDM